MFKSHAWGILHTLLEMFSYRMHHIQPHYRVQLLSHLHSLAAVPQRNQNQLHLWWVVVTTFSCYHGFFFFTVRWKLFKNYTMFETGCRYLSLLVLWLWCFVEFQQTVLELQLDTSRSSLQLLAAVYLRQEISSIVSRDVRKSLSFFHWRKGAMPAACSHNDWFVC